MDKAIPFLDELVTGGTIKVKVYRTKTHRDQYQHFGSHHTLIHKLGVVRTLYERSDNIVTDEKYRQEEIKQINKALLNCGYPSWVRHHIDNKLPKGEKSKTREKGVDQV